MKLSYQTGTATLIQFVALTLLNVATGISSTTKACRQSSSDCLGDVLISLVFFLLVVSWFAVICMVGFLAQEKRSRKLAFLLIGMEMLVVMVAVFNARHHPDFIGMVTSIVDLILAIWIIILAIRLSMIGGGRAAPKSRPRQRKRRTTN